MLAEVEDDGCSRIVAIGLNPGGLVRQSGTASAKLNVDRQARQEPCDVEPDATIKPAAIDDSS